MNSYDNFEQPSLAGLYKHHLPQLVKKNRVGHLAGSSVSFAFIFSFTLTIHHDLGSGIV